MWCPNCQSDQQAVDTAQGTRCRNCNESLRPSYSTSSLRDARDIIAKWSSSDLLDQISALPQIPEMKPPEQPPQPTATAAPLNKTAADSVSTSQEPAAAAESSATLEARALPKPDAPTEEAEQADGPTEAVTASTAPTTSAGLPTTGGAGESDPSSTESAASSAESDSPSGESKLELAGSSSAARRSEQVSQPEGTQADSRPIPSTSAREHAAPAPPDHRDVLTPPSSAVRPPRMDFVKAMNTNFDETSQQAKPDAQAQSRKRRLQLRNEQRRKQRSRRAESKAEPKGIEHVKRKLRVDSLDPVADTQPAAPVEPTRNAGGGRIQSNSPRGGVRQRIDSGQPVDQTLNTGDSRPRTQTRPRQRFIDEPHGTGIRGPHFEVTAPRRSNLTSMTGQFLAYIGVLGLTVGTAMVIYGHFGGHAQYTPTGWLVTTVAQMMLFLGVINLVSGGIEQNNDDVSARINHIGEQLLRIEQVTEEAVRGPKINPRRYAEGDEYVEEHETEAVTVGVRR